ncbi:Crp/Fnr family transcriptional regulator [Hydrogenophaga sp.]|uniref:Crp/Fnr family transcriptional regulator n=1 Tax=Hydrogenophaga sp. TaxID=1904254 RepID=UPI00271EB281|nr:Crp/Fnr family transcriptional regulator [Hydrogenophaga sp.]MDO8906755.1 Crp/Fnr family transcriptional regulator [Hydrogenophaga sp.]
MSTRENHLLLQLPQSARKHFMAQCEPFDLVLSAQLSERETTLTHAYFPRDGFISQVIDVPSHPTLEVGMVGYESMLGAELILGLSKTPWRAVVQGHGTCWRMAADTLRTCSEAIPELHDLLNRTLLVRLHQQSLATVCERFHMIGPRLARWMLMSQDRAESDSFDVTQEFMAMMLGVRRVGVTLAAGELQDGGLIEYHRGHLTVLDRTQLESRACNCYAADKLIYRDLMGGPMPERRG